MDPELRDKIIQTHTMVEGINGRLKKVDDKLDRHEKDISGLKNFRSWLVGIFSTGAAGGGAFASFHKFFGGG